MSCLVLSFTVCLSTATVPSTILSHQAWPIDGSQYEQELHPTSRHSPHGTIETQRPMATSFR